MPTPDEVAEAQAIFEAHRARIAKLKDRDEPESREDTPELRAAVKKHRPDVPDKAFDNILVRLYSERNGWRATSLKSWVGQVLAIDVQLEGAGRAVLQEPDTTFRVEIRWAEVPVPSEDQGIGKTTTMAQELRVIPVSRPGLPWTGPVDISVYYAAFFFRMQEPAPAKFKPPKTRPEPGKAPKPTFYLALLESYEVLVREGVRGPAAELARRMKENPSTVRSWLYRARRMPGQTTPRDARA